MLCTIFAPVIPCVALYAFLSCHLMLMRGQCVRTFFPYAAHHNVIYSNCSFGCLNFFLDKLDIHVSGCFLQPVEYLEVAEKAAKFIKENLYDASSKRLHHSYRNGPSKAPGFLDDYAFLISGLLDLYEFGGKIEWLLWAIQLQVTQAS